MDGLNIKMAMTESVNLKTESSKLFKVKNRKSGRKISKKMNRASVTYMIPKDLTIM